MQSSAVVNVADAFAVQPEATSMYSFLASPPATLNPTDPVQIAGVDLFINQIYQNLFNRAADTSGLNYWQTQILSGAVSVGSPCMLSPTALWERISQCWLTRSRLLRILHSKPMGQT